MEVEWWCSMVVFNGVWCVCFYAVCVCSPPPCHKEGFVLHARDPFIITCMHDVGGSRLKLLHRTSIDLAVLKNKR